MGFVGEEEEGNRYEEGEERVCVREREGEFFYFLKKNCVGTAKAVRANRFSGCPIFTFFFFGKNNMQKKN